MKLILKNTIDLDPVILDVVDKETSRKNYAIDVALPEGMPDGEYEYTLENGGEVLSTGLLVIGKAEESKQYIKSISYEQYEAE